MIIPREQQRQQQVKVAAGIAAALLVIGLIVILGRNHSSNKEDSKPATTAPITSTKSGPDTPTDAVSNNYAAIVTNMGTIVIELYPSSAPKTVTNFCTLAARGYYNNLTFHRVVKDFVIQGGDPSGDGTGGQSIYGSTFADEINAKSLGLSDQLIQTYEAKGYTYRSDIVSHKIVVGSVAMANSGPDTNGSQFFIVTSKDQPSLDGRFTVFGQVVSGMDIVKKIEEVEVDVNSRPKTTVSMTKIVTADTKEEVVAAAK